MDEGKLLDALALSDRFLRNGASDRLLQMLIISMEDDTSSGPSQGSSGFRSWSNSWQYCLRLTDKQQAARLALMYDDQVLLQSFNNIISICHSLTFIFSLDICTNGSWKQLWMFSLCAAAIYLIVIHLKLRYLKWL